MLSKHACARAYKKKTYTHQMPTLDFLVTAGGKGAGKVVKERAGGKDARPTISEMMLLS